MTQTTLEKTISLLEREISGTSDIEKARTAERLRALLSPKRRAPAYVFDDEDELFDNMPV